MSGASFSLERLDFDPSSPSAGPNIGSYLRAGSDGDLLTSTLLSGKESLDINIAGSDIDLNVDIQLDDLVADDEVDAESPLKAGSRAHLQSAILGSVSDDGDKADQISDIYRRVWTTSAPNVGWLQVNTDTNATPDTADQIDSAKQAGRQYWIFQNRSNNPMSVGPSGVTTDSGFEVGKGSSLSLDMGEALDVFVVSGSADQAFQFTQVG